MSTDMPEWEVLALDEEATEGVVFYYKLIWDSAYGLSDTDGLDAGHRAGVFFAERTGWSPDLCLERGLDIAFDVLNDMRRQHD